MSPGVLLLLPSRSASDSFSPQGCIYRKWPLYLSDYKEESAALWPCLHLDQKDYRPQIKPTVQCKCASPDNAVTLWPQDKYRVCFEKWRREFVNCRIKWQNATSVNTITPDKRNMFGHLRNWPCFLSEVFPEVPLRLFPKAFSIPNY
jgi:hypothetical protein